VLFDRPSVAEFILGAVISHQLRLSTSVGRRSADCPRYSSEFAGIGRKEVPAAAAAAAGVTEAPGSAAADGINVHGLRRRTSFGGQWLDRVWITSSMSLNDADYGEHQTLGEECLRAERESSKRINTDHTRRRTHSICPKRRH
jgi:hypothetical protein